jgi:hypothetical protein
MNWVINVLLQHHLRLYMLYNYKYNIQKNIFEFVTERNICDGKENVCDGKDILVYNNNYQHRSKARG